jgi:hypothetical protein
MTISRLFNRPGWGGRIAPRAPTISTPAPEPRPRCPTTADHTAPSGPRATLAGPTLALRRLGPRSKNSASRPSHSVGAPGSGPIAVGPTGRPRGRGLRRPSCLGVAQADLLRSSMRFLNRARILPACLTQINSNLPGRPSLAKSKSHNLIRARENQKTRTPKTIEWVYGGQNSLLWSHRLSTITRTRKSPTQQYRS